jgi:hypothetical protein
MEGDPHWQLDSFHSIGFGRRRLSQSDDSTPRVYGEAAHAPAVWIVGKICLPTPDIARLPRNERSNDHAVRQTFVCRAIRISAKEWIWFRASLDPVYVSRGRLRYIRSALLGRLVLGRLAHP